MSAATAQATPATIEAQANALLRRARIGIAFAAQSSNEYGFAFWQGTADAAAVLLSGAASTMAQRDALLSDKPQTRHEAAGAALPVCTKNLTLVQVRQILATQGAATLSQRVVDEGALCAAHAAPENCLQDTDLAKHRIGPGAGAQQVHAPASAAPMPLRVVAGKAIKPLLTVLRMRLSLHKLRAQIGVLALQRPDPLTQKGQVLAQHRRRAALVDQRLQFIEQRLKHFILQKPIGGHGSEGGAA